MGEEKAPLLETDTVLSTVLSRASPSDAELFRETLTECRTHYECIENEHIKVYAGANVPRCCKGSTMMIVGALLWVSIILFPVGIPLFFYGVYCNHNYHAVTLVVEKGSSGINAEYGAMGEEKAPLLETDTVLSTVLSRASPSDAELFRETLTECRTHYECIENEHIKVYAGANVPRCCKGSTMMIVGALLWVSIILFPVGIPLFFYGVYCNHNYHAVTLVVEKETHETIFWRGSIGNYSWAKWSLLVRVLEHDRENLFTFDHASAIISGDVATMQAKWNTCNDNVAQFITNLH
eukprot:TRINITY_DN1433_c0_g1_i1.p1 TRINITY_DN1433_c0_g1~~TRINITY_DN1433_c0_g1_i1.p1  ORF type:complete len:294 (+),score=47.26 TRINITY_DN1433_c0_g1_i1:123-1004(+)